jgi:hypothetical protein
MVKSNVGPLCNYFIVLCSSEGKRIFHYDVQGESLWRKIIMKCFERRRVETLRAETHSRNSPMHSKVELHNQEEHFNYIKLIGSKVYKCGKGVRIEKKS